MSTERRPGFPNEEPEEEKTLEEWMKWYQKGQKREYRPIRLFVTPFERMRLASQTDESMRFTLALAAVLSVAEIAERFVPKNREEVEQVSEKINEARALQVRPITPEEVESQNEEGVINLVKSTRTMSGKINLVEKLKPDQLDTLRQRYPDFEAVITGLSKRIARKEKAQNRILDIYQRRGEDATRP